MILTVISSVFGQEKRTVYPVDFNTDQKEFSPVYFQDGIVFCGVGLQNTAITFVDDQTGQRMTDLFFIPLNSKNIHEKKLFSPHLQTSFHDGPITFSKDGNVAYFTRSLLVHKKLRNSIKTTNKLGVFKATFNGTQWGNIEPLGFNSDEYNVGQPCLSKDGKTLYVVSDKEGGYGKKDIYYAELKDGEFGSLINLGANVNSSANEMFPSVYSSNQMYFSSDKPGGFGGLDFYSAIKKEGEWQSNLVKDTLLNTEFDDFSIVYNAQGNEGYFTSNRNGSDDLFKFTITYPAFTNCEEMIKEQLCFEFFEEATLNVDSVALKYEWNFGDGSKEENLEVYHCYEKPGFYIVELNVMDPVIDKVFVNQDTYELEIEEVIQPTITPSDTFLLNEWVHIKVAQGKWTDYQIDNYYVQHDDSFIIKNNYIGYQYDSIGSKEVQLLIQGIDTNTNEIVMNCFYKTIYIVTNKDRHPIQKKNYEILNLDGFMVDKMKEEDDSYFALELLTSPNSLKGDSIQLKKYVNIVRETFNKEDQLFSYLLGKTVTPMSLFEQFKNAHDNGFEQAQVKQFKNDANEVIMDDLGAIEVDSLGNAQVILKNIYFNYSSHHLTEESKVVLNQLAFYLIANKRKIEVGAHTDDKGTIQYNLTLSEKRANSVVEYLTIKGVDKNLLIAKGYGEYQPKVPNRFKDGSDNPEGRAMNRRVTIKFLTN